jgi:hypothetical protein
MAPPKERLSLLAVLADEPLRELKRREADLSLNDAQVPRRGCPPPPALMRSIANIVNICLSFEFCACALSGLHSTRWEYSISTL